MTQAKEKDRVTINFIGKLADGTIIDSTYADPEEDLCNDDDCCHEHGPMELIIGDGDFYTPVETALVGMQVGEKKTVTITPDDGFGDYDPENVFSVKRSELPEDIIPEVGMGLEVTGEDEDLYMVTIVKVSDEEVSLDSNHPLAGEELTYEFDLVEIL
ncbi:MAG: FKBP-type peptidyl-prolyl cis-trans isomerase [Deltaproteobacteria bacterium]|jgi:peptidylprolyl isomerase|nr:FKBP-type peptidyl-prolyl cis-trans isomerase [Deltaproteobacteria bacterium]MCW8893221.1 FKBP-type peptidyl-prolyl cis-trans isomerase [Deltaproteobacteria bacterium]MCW9050359.1 FKBP-type peptidyl-prolyl cis-trans isomerase [Deltaproteobacteria bacterium]